MKKTIFISTAEISADQYGAQLAQALWALDPELNLVGLGSVHMKEVGVTLIDDIVTTSSVGLVEAVRFLPVTLSTIEKIKRYLKQNPPDVFLAMDAQGFHMRLLPAVKKMGIKTAYFIAPQEWHWGTKKGGQRVIDVVDQIFTIFKEESKFYEALGKNVTFVGHPLCDFKPHIIPKPDFFKTFGFDEKEPLVGIFPGSRYQEIERVCPLLLKAAKEIRKVLPKVQFGLSVADPRYEARISELIAEIGVPYVKLMDITHSKTLMKHARVNITSSGTVTLEQALLGTPAVATYKLHPLTYFIGRTILAMRTKNITWISLPNILEKKEICKEFVQRKAKYEGIAAATLELLTNEKEHARICAELEILKKNLGEPGVIKRVAEGLLTMME